ncbi:MAG TPA: AraC family transcriptional regulator [Streptosporangiaceae bacterium]|nr:AraC family transcriptional regulator [Streptosporangiaceae bacterium]
MACTASCTTVATSSPHPYSWPLAFAASHPCVEQLAAVTGLPVRRLQRLFAEYVGVGPKWVMRRARLHEAAERADRGLDVAWAELASDLGYADQAHLTREFTAMIGVPPGRYARA